MNGYKRAILNWGLVMILLTIIAVVSIGLILSPAVIHTEVWQREYISAPSAFTREGLILRAESWKTYPEYNIGLGFIAILAFTGAIYVCQVMYTLKSENDALQSNSSGV